MRRQRRLLLVDDADDIRAIARLSLERIGGWEVTAVPSGQEAIEALAGIGVGDAASDTNAASAANTTGAINAPGYDAILLDVMMPGLDGPRTLRLLRELGLAEMPVVFLTAKAGDAERERLLALGAVGVIAKPFDPLKLADELERTIEPTPHSDDQ